MLKQVQQWIDGNVLANDEKLIDLGGETQIQFDDDFFTFFFAH